MASARRTGTAESVSTYGAGQTYSVLATWESATDNNNVTGTVSPVLECLAAQYADTVVLAGATNDATYFRIIRPQAGNFHTGIRDTGVRFYITTNTVVFALQENNSQVQDVLARITNSSASARLGFAATTAGTGGAFVGCIGTNIQNSGSGAHSAFQMDRDGVRCVDCLAENIESTGFYTNGSATTVLCYNCTSINSLVNGFIQFAGTFNLKNCLADATAGTDFAGTFTATNCASGDTSATGTGARASQTFTFVNAAGFDYHLATNDAGAKGFGTDLSADGTYAFNDDIDRQTITTWSIGFDSLLAEDMSYTTPIMISAGPRHIYAKREIVMF